ncbi:MAG: glycosyltransferase family 2 protein [Patescibacteria group bacterium]
MNNPKITIITCTYNSARHLRATLNSVKEQTYRNFEHLFIDGGSTDDTLNIIREYYKEPTLVSGRDKGLYEAFNKGLNNAKGQIIGFLHSDDVFFDKKSLERVATAFLNPDIDYYCSRMIICDEELEKPFALLGAAPHRQTGRDQLYSSTYFAHPTYYCKREIIERVGKFDLRYTVAADIDWLYRLEQTTNRFYFDPLPLVKFRGKGGTSARRYFVGLSEEMAIRLKNEKPSLIFFLIYGYHYWRRGTRFILEKLKLFRLVDAIREIIIKTRK